MFQAILYISVGVLASGLIANIIQFRQRHQKPPSKPININRHYPTTAKLSQDLKTGLTKAISAELQSGGFASVNIGGIQYNLSLEKSQQWTK